MNRDIATLVAAMDCGPCTCPAPAPQPPKKRSDVVQEPPQRTSWLSKLLPFKTLAAVLFRLN